MKINEMLSLDGCWNMVNRIQLANSPEQIRERCRIASEWLGKNKMISTEDFDSLMMAVSQLHRESYHMERHFA